MLNLTPFLHVLGDGATGEYKQGELMMYGFGPLALAALIFWVGLKLQFAGKPAWIKWIAIVPLCVGVIIGIAPTQVFYTDQVYQAMYGGTWKKGLMHSAGIWVSILGAVGLVVWNRWVGRQKFEDL